MHRIFHNFEIPSFRWVIPGKLAASAMPFSIEQIKKAEIQSVVSLVPESEQLFRTKGWLEKAKAAGITVHTIPIENLKAPSRRQFAHFLRIMHEAETGKPRKVLLHCAGGVGRAGTMAAAYLIAVKRQFLEEAYKTIIGGLRQVHFDTLTNNKRFVARLRREGLSLQDFFRLTKTMFPESAEQEDFLKEIERRFLVYTGREGRAKRLRRRRKPRRKK